MIGRSLLHLAFLAAPAAAAVAASGGTFAAEWRGWHDARMARLAAPDGWLALAGLHWLADGENRIPGLPGVFVLEHGGVTLRASPADGWTEGGRPVGQRAQPDVLANGARTATVIDRGGRLALRVWDAESPTRKAFRGVDTFPPNPAWRIEATWEAYPAPRKVEVPSVVGIPTEETAPGRAHFMVGGNVLALEPTVDPDGSLFFVFRDATARRETYGAGRFLSAAPPRDGKVVLDFNRAVNPPCAFTPYATCPLPLPENVLPVRIEAGEKRWGGGH